MSPFGLVLGIRCQDAPSACGCIELDGKPLSHARLPPLHDGCDCSVLAVVDAEGRIFAMIHRAQVEVVVEPLLWGQCRLCVGDVGKASYRDVWDYQSPVRAIAAAAAWDPFEQKEPDGWHRHVASGRRRVDGDPSRETVGE